ncbi:MATE family efflux transporter [Paracoccus sp. S-4012]|uniref:MATE family efflux transporter n=1 Tax=Paracoccus sp. S-4012 TaxID=2665648 RepID=UPI0012B0667D|nr:MATE family efflux transporter [Paracoccus sp. S-4012]MRX50832.1 MATE family efflux transporter [Paracoccus sp. S-4012]
MSRRPQFQTGPLWRAFLVFLLPMMAQNILQSLSATLSAIIVGRSLGTLDLAAVATFLPVVMFFIAFMIGLSAGSSVLVGQAFGAGRMEMVQRVAGTSIGVTLGLGAVIAGVGVFAAPAILDLLGVPPDIRTDAIAYARAMFVMMPALFFYVLGASLLRGMGDTMRPLAIQALATLLTGVLVWLLITQTPLGVRGAAYGQGLAQIAGVVALVLWLRAVRHPLALNRALLARMRPDPKLLRQVLRLGLPTAVQIVAGSLSALVIVGLVNSFGSDATAAYGAVSQVQNYVQFPALSIAIAASIFGAQMIGGGRSDRLGEVIRTAMVMNLVLTGSLVALALIFSRPVVALFITDAGVVDLAQRLLHIVIWSSLMFGAGTIFSGVMRASGTVLAPMLIAVGSIFLVELPVAVWLSGRIGLPGIWWGYVAGFGALMLGQAAWYWFVWRKRTITSLV